MSEEMDIVADVVIDPEGGLEGEALTEDMVNAEDFGEKEPEPLTYKNMYEAMTLLTRGGHFIYPGETVELDHATAQALLIKGKVRLVGEGE